MAQQATQTTRQTKSLLEKFHLGYELDKTWQDAKRDVKLRTENKHKNKHSVASSHTLLPLALREG